MKVSAGLVPSEGSDGELIPRSLLAADGCWQPWAFLGLRMHHSPSSLHLHTASSVSLDLFPLLFSYKDVSLDLGPTLTQDGLLSGSVITPAKTLIPNRGRVWGSRWTHRLGTVGNCELRVSTATCSFKLCFDLRLTWSCAWICSLSCPVH